ncbi:hypothetical protein A1A1_01338 [Planococcus antarcticus DSM 14505]|uniref:Uncharacterized protein n=1 Tax=Planococcus antarcticus DSM 14505 TaxID=1185653 RepID=A0AA87IRD5_9BACL|nr:hypothetical protein [Planococcus antarcticus]EIM08333.1 hypothetical protein A1A1_01338 [Planococcus antarcticus DSM 14505]
MNKFIDTHPDYKNYSSEKYFTDEITRDFVDAFKGFIIGHITNTGQFKNIISIIAKNVPCSPGSNWGFPWLHEDLDDVLWNLQRKNRFPKFMDCIIEITATYFKTDIEDVNDVLEDSLIGYYLENDLLEGLTWKVREDIEASIQSVSEALEEIPLSFKNTIDHLEQAKEQLARIDNPRARKDALRDCVSALEAHLKYLSGKNDFRQCVSELVDEKIGDKKILKDALTIWRYVHEDVPDIRHGHDANISLEKEEVLYYIDRTMSLIKYLSRIYS